MEIDKVLLQTMLREFWLTSHNNICRGATVAFLKRIGLSNKEIEDWIEVSPSIINTEEANETLDDALKDTRNYYSNEED